MSDNPLTSVHIDSIKFGPECGCDHGALHHLKQILQIYPCNAICTGGVLVSTLVFCIQEITIQYIYGNMQHEVEK